MTTSVPESRSPQDAPGFDADALRARYREERDKRLRDDGNAQYVEVKGRFAHYLDDPYAEPGFTRAPLADTVEVVVIGGGFGGLLAGARLRQAGVADIRIIDPAQDFGGTWYWNRYPGIACDIESYTYLPLLEEVGYMPKEKYSYGPEILEIVAVTDITPRTTMAPTRAAIAVIAGGACCAPTACSEFQQMPTPPMLSTSPTTNAASVSIRPWP